MVTALTLVASLCVAFPVFPEVPVGQAPPPPEELPQPPPPPPLAEPVPTSPQARPLGEPYAPEVEVKTRRRYRLFEARALGTFTFPTNSSPAGRDFLVGVRGELDVLMISTIFIWDRQGISPINLDETVTETNFWNGLVGASVYATKHSRIRLLAGLSSVSNDTSAVFGPSVGFTARAGIPILSIEGAMLYTPAGFQQFDGRIEAVARLLIFELRAGYRGRWIETDLTGNRPFVLPSGGFTVSAGLAF